ncbi:hypothetical protein BH11CYA1_BH11CYA1_25680 [soil metagenome]
MSETDDHHWEDFAQWCSFALHQLVYVPACCLHAIEQELRAKHGDPKITHKPHRYFENHPLKQIELAASGPDYHEKAAIHDQPHVCRNCGGDIITRVYSNDAHEHLKLNNQTFQTWLSNEQPTLDINQALPHPTGYEQNLLGFSDEHLQRIEKYWSDHQITSPNCAFKSAKLATAADWEETKRQALEDSEVSA